MNRQQLLQHIRQLQQRSGVQPMTGQLLGQPSGPPLHDACGHFHWHHDDQCPPAGPCGSMLCCVN